MARLTRAQVREIDRRSIEEFQIPGIVLMENASRAAASVAWEMLEHRPDSVLVVCGAGNNGGDGLAVARHLHNLGAQVTIHPAVAHSKYTGDALINWQIVEAMKLPLGWLAKPALIVDALFGTGLSQPPRPDGATVIHRMNDANVPILAVDLPSGLDCDTGDPLGPCVKAVKTVTFVAEKIGFTNPVSRQYTGDVIVADIGCPRELIEEVGRSSR
ncbi:MAG TPA: NAD(P)H-hydrate epimerase [Tepidisphaeraceae bacterium]|nr:NAD(P)H-hydrate epimerase [Tepidisphaeraceae bacterium]